MVLHWVSVFVYLLSLSPSPSLLSLSLSYPYHLPSFLLHSILYHSMGQPKDSLQAYLCALYLDPLSLPCWTDLGCLYEAVSQPV